LTEGSLLRRERKMIGDTLAPVHARDRFHQTPTKPWPVLSVYIATPPRNELRSPCRRPAGLPTEGAGK
jgi:hypothetical protein